MAFLSSVTSRRMESKSPLPPERARISSASPELRRSSRVEQGPQAPTDNGDGDPVAQGITQCGEFVGCIRCMQVHKRAAASAGGIISVWTGEQDGALCVRNGQGQGLYTIEKKPTVFVSSLLCHGSEHFPSKYMYVGLSDGNVRVYEQVRVDQRSDPTYKLVCEVRRHNAAVSCMIAVRQYVVTGGQDWWMYVWEWLGGPPYEGGQLSVLRDRDSFPGPGRTSRGYFGGKLSLHKNTVRCMAYDQAAGVLYSGGDDATIYAVPWTRDGPNSQAAQVMGGGAARQLHKKGVRALAVYECFLFSAAEDGTIKVWQCLFEDDSGRLVGGHVVSTIWRGDSPMRCLFKDPAGGRIWAGGADGAIRVFNAHDFQQACVMREHAGGAVTGLHGVGRVDAQQWWIAGTDGVCRVMYLESEAPVAEADQRSLEQAGAQGELSFELDRLRTQAICNFAELDRRKSRLALIQHMDKGRKSALVESFKGAMGARVGVRYFRKLERWWLNHRDTLRKRQIADLLWLNLDRGVVRIYLRKWVSHQRTNKRTLLVLRFAEALQRGSAAGMQALYFARLREYTRRWNAQRIKILACEALLGRHTLGGLAAIFGQWLRHHRNYMQTTKRNVISQMLMKQSDSGLRTVYWYRLKSFLRREQAAQARGRLSRALTSECSASLRSLYYARLKAFARGAARKRRLKEFSQAMLGLSQNGIRRLYHRRAVLWTAAVPRRNLAVEYEKLGDEVRELDDLLKQDDMTDEEIAAAMAELQDDMQSLVQDKARLNDRIDGQEEKLRVVQTSLAAEDRPEIDFGLSGKTKEEAALTVMRKLGVFAVNSRMDHNTLSEAHKARKQTSPAKAWHDGWTLLQDGLRNWLAKPKGGNLGEKCAADIVGVQDAPWKVPEDWAARMDDRTMHQQCHLGVKRMVIAAHRLLSPEFCQDPKGDAKRHAAFVQQIEQLCSYSGMLETLVQNCDVLCEVVFRVKDDREARDHSADDALNSTQQGMARGDSVQASPRGTAGDSAQRSPARARGSPRATSPPPREPAAAAPAAVSPPLGGSIRVRRGESADVLGSSFTAGRTSGRGARVANTSLNRSGGDSADLNASGRRQLRGANSSLNRSGDIDLAASGRLGASQLGESTRSIRSPASGGNGPRLAGAGRGRGGQRPGAAR
eukprot:TRINITY_DN553_c0_g1_i2.p1 TRINITY_DN553_c0_g1~~TRINITY_DN553_c0_g1_i2.p1  ORF type:complete len:1190 (+),score=372.59 TRINITY_DN553_c0_g1_i2:108-3572(+)